MNYEDIIKEEEDEVRLRLRIRKSVNFCLVQQGSLFSGLTFRILFNIFVIMPHLNSQMQIHSTCMC